MFGSFSYNTILVIDNTIFLTGWQGAMSIGIFVTIPSTYAQGPANLLWLDTLVTILLWL